MAPEQLAGTGATRQSDLYALGLVLYELFTGKPPFAGSDLQELQRQRADTPKTTPSTLIPDIGPRLESAILRCLEPDPNLRPASALEVAVSLPGGDPLAEALAAGETPSPDLLAASGPEKRSDHGLPSRCLVRRSGVRDGNLSCAAGTDSRATAAEASTGGSHGKST